MIGQEVNSPAQKLLRSARRKRGALQGVNVLNCSHVVPASSACTLETNQLLFEKIISYAWSMGANYLRRGNVTNGRPLSILGQLE
jgi:hypothetical protein